MEIKFLCTYWGMDGSSAQTFMDKVLSVAGYDGVEVNPGASVELMNGVRKLAEQHDMHVIGQRRIEIERETFAEYRARAAKHMTLIYQELSPNIINSHTGREWFSFDENCTLLDDAFEFSAKHNIKVIHETHRGHFAPTPKILEPYLEKFPELEMTADFAHWVTVAESLMQDQETFLAKAINRSAYIHARVSHEQGSQVPNPFDAQWKQHLDCFTGWWMDILNQKKAAGVKEFYISPEAGPPPYMPCKFGTTEPVASQWHQNLDMMAYLKKLTQNL